MGGFIIGIGIGIVFYGYNGGGAIPTNVILTEDSLPLMTEAGLNLLIE